MILTGRYNLINLPTLNQLLSLMCVVKTTHFSVPYKQLHNLTNLLPFLCSLEKHIRFFPPTCLFFIMLYTNTCDSGSLTSQVIGNCKRAVCAVFVFNTEKANYLLMHHCEHYGATRTRY